MEIYRTHLQTPWPLHLVSVTVVSLGMPLLESKWQKTFNKNSCMSSSYSVLSSLVLDFSFSYWGSGCPRYMERKCRRLPAIEGSSFHPGCSLSSLIHDLVPYVCRPQCCGTLSSGKATLQDFVFPSFSSHFRFYPASKKKSAVSSVVLRAWGNNEKWNRGLKWFWGTAGGKGSWSTSQCSHRSSCCGATGTAKQNTTQ